MRCKKRRRIGQPPPRLHSPTSARFPEVLEFTDDELLKMAEEQGHFRFLEDPEEDIYTWDDGEPIW